MCTALALGLLQLMLFNATLVTLQQLIITHALASLLCAAALLQQQAAVTGAGLYSPLLPIHQRCASAERGSDPLQFNTQLALAANKKWLHKREPAIAGDAATVLGAT